MILMRAAPEQQWFTYMCKPWNMLLAGSCSNVNHKIEIINGILIILYEVISTGEPVRWVTPRAPSQLIGQKVVEY